VTDQPSTPPMGERRRRREAERRRAQETGEGLSPPMTRRERRALEEALASGALELTPGGQYAPTGELPVTTTGQHALSGMETAASAETTATETTDTATTETEQRGSKPEEPVAAPSSPQPPERQSWRDTAQEVEALRPPPTMAPTPDGGASGDPAPSPGPGGAGEQNAVPGQVSRRSLRERRVESGDSPAERPSERTATGRRPVIRPPASALGTRSVDGATGELTSIQRAIRDINAAPDEPVGDSVLHPIDTGSPEEAGGAAEDADEEETGSPEETSSPEAAEPIPEASSSAEESSSASPTEPSAQEVSPTAASGEEDEVDDSFDMSPRWPRVAAVTSRSPEPAREGMPPVSGEAPPSAVTAGDDPSAGASPTGAEAQEPGHGPALDSPAEDEESEESEESEEDDERHTPRLLQGLYRIVLVLAGVVLGLLVWRMANGDLFGDGDALATASHLLVLRQ